jgi:hypothetical protein
MKSLQTLVFASLAACHTVPLIRPSLPEASWNGMVQQYAVSVHQYNNAQGGCARREISIQLPFKQNIAASFVYAVDRDCNLDIEEMRFSNPQTYSHAEATRLNTIITRAFRQLVPKEYRAATPQSP